MIFEKHIYEEEKNWHLLIEVDKTSWKMHQLKEKNIYNYHY